MMRSLMPCFSSIIISTPPPLDIPSSSQSHSPPSPTSSSSSSSSSPHQYIVPPPSYPIYSIPGPSSISLNPTVYPGSIHSGVYISGYGDIHSNESIASDGSERIVIGGRIDSKTHPISLSLHDFHLNSVTSPPRGNSEYIYNHV